MCVYLASGALKWSYLWKLISFLLKTYERAILLLSFEEAARGNVTELDVQPKSPFPFVHLNNY